MQVNYKMKVFLTFVTFLKSIGNLADMSINKISGTRLKNNVLKELIVQRSKNINVLRTKKERIEKIVNFLHKIK